VFRYYLQDPDPEMRNNGDGTATAMSLWQQLGREMARSFLRSKEEHEHEPLDTPD
jgi:hypothetical protein